MPTQEDRNEYKKKIGLSVCLVAESCSQISIRF